VTTLRFIDATSLADAQKAGPADGTAFYLPGGDAYRAWTISEVHGIATRYRLPVFVRSNPALSRVTGDVDNAVAGLHAFAVPRGTLLALDSETSVNPAYVQEFWSGIRAAGYRLIDYGSQSVVFGNQNPDGYYWGADWTDVPHVHPGDQATQFASFSNFDVSEFSPALPLWDTRPPAPPARPAEVAVKVNLPVIVFGTSDAHLPHWYVHRIQAIANGVWNKGLAVDGVFGPKTQAAIQALQSQYGLPAAERGQVGQVTWGLLLAGA